MQRLTVTSSSIRPVLNENETQIILHRHCNYDKSSGELLKDSIKEQQRVVSSFIETLDPSILENTYFLFTSSNTTYLDNYKRCVETTNIAMDMLLKYLQKNNIPTRNIINLDSNTNYKGKVHESNHLTEPMMFIDNTGYLEFLKQKHSGINKEFWIDFEEDLSRLERERLGAEGPDEIVQRANYYISVLERYSKYFHTKHPNSRLIIWNGTHYDLISPLVKQDILNLEKSDVVNVENCGGVSLIVDKDGLITANINGVIYPFDFQETKQLHPHF